MLRVNDIFESISGEAGGFPQGTWTTFIRLQGCNLLCSWPCDTPRAQDVHALCYEMEIPSILKMIRNKHVLITGGEPLIQNETLYLIKELQRCGHTVQVETNGSLNLHPLKDVHWVVDRKGPSSGMSKWMLTPETLSDQVKGIQQAGGHVYFKWVVGNDEDIDYMLADMEKFLYGNGTVIPFIISPVDAKGGMITDIVEKVWEKNSMFLDNIIFSVQLHKIFNMA